MSLTVRIVTQEEPSKWEPWRKVITEELLGITPEDAYKYIEEEVLDIPKEKWSSFDEYWTKCWRDWDKTEKNLKWAEHMFDYYRERYEFWYEEKTGEAFKNWLTKLESPLFTIQYANVMVEVFNNDRKEDADSNG